MTFTNKHDDALFDILQEERQIVPFLEAVFGFLYRRTDFFLVQENPTSKLGFPPGIAEKTVRALFRKWQSHAVASHNDTTSCIPGELRGLETHHEEEVVCTDSEVQQPSEEYFKDREVDLSSETYNGADCGTYRWSQTLSEVDIKVPVPENVHKSKDVHIDIGASQLKVEVKEGGGQWTTLVEGELVNKHHKEESIWTLMPGRIITIHLQKTSEKWWNSLLSSETPLDSKSLDITKSITELPDEDKMEVEKVLLQEERKRKGLVSVEHQQNLDKLKEAWNLEGSPFRGRPFDPSVLLPLPQQ